MALFRDNLLFGAAEALARQIEAYWRDRGHHTVKAWTELVDGMNTVYQVRSNLVRGLPPE